MTHQKWCIVQRQADKFQRLADNSLDEENHKKYKSKSVEWNEIASDSVVNSADSYIINSIEIDELTPCLRRLKDGKIVDTMVYQISPIKEDFKDWEFDWTIPEKNGYEVYELIAEGEHRTQGMIALKPDKASNAMEIDIVESAPHNNPHIANSLK